MSHNPRSPARPGIVRTVVESVSEALRMRREMAERYPRTFIGE